LDDYSQVLDEKETAAANLACARLQNQLWSEAMGVVAKAPVPVPSGIFVSSLTDLMDAASKRDAARENHVPQPDLLTGLDGILPQILMERKGLRR
jgi:hypothetical protein